MLSTQTLKATGTPEKTTVNLNTTGLVKAMENTSTAPSPHLHKTETAHQGITGSLTSRMDLRPITSEAHHLQQNTHSLPGGLHSVQEREGSNSFPAWAIVVVILMAVIILLIFLGLIFLVRAVGIWGRRGRKGQGDTRDEVRRVIKREKMGLGI